MNNLTITDYLDNLDSIKQDTMNRLLDNNVIIDEHMTFTDTPTKLEEVYNNALNGCIDPTFTKVPNGTTSSGVLRGWVNCIDKIPENLIFYSPLCCFYNFQGPSLPQNYTFSQNKITSLERFCRGCSNVDTINVDLTNHNCAITTMEAAFDNCKNVKSISITGINDFSSLVNTREMFSNCINLVNFPNIDMSNVTNAYSMFYHCDKMEQLPAWVNTSSLTSLSYFIANCPKLKSIHLLDFGKVTRVTDFLYRCPALTDVAGFKDLGKSYDNTKQEGYSDYSLDLRNINLTLNSLYNIITNLYDIKSIGCKPQHIILSYDYIHKSEIPDDYINLLESKGWKISYSL